MFEISKSSTARLLGLALGFSANLISPSAWAVLTDEEARATIIQMQTRIETLNNRIVSLERALQTSAQGQIQLLNENERIRSEISRLRGQLEEANLAASTMKAQQQDLYRDIDKRLQEQPKKMTALEEKLAGLVEEQRTVIAGLEKRLKLLEPTVIQLSGVNYQVSANEKNSFEEIRSALGAKKFQSVIRLTQQFEKKHPGSTLLGDVLFIQGTAFYAEKDLKSSIAARRELMKQFPDHPTIPQAMLNLAAGLEETGSTKTAQRVLEDLIKNYPKSSAAAVARKRLK